MLIQARVAETSIETLDKRILDRLPGLDETEPDSGLLRPEEHGLAGQFRAVVEDDFPRQ